MVFTNILTKLLITEQFLRLRLLEDNMIVDIPSICSKWMSVYYFVTWLFKLPGVYVEPFLKLLDAIWYHVVALAVVSLLYLMLVYWCDNWSCFCAIYFNIWSFFYYTFYVFILYILYVFVWCQCKLNVFDVFSILMYWWVIVLNIIRVLLRSNSIMNK